jgi:hypothetical protein
MHQNKSLDTFHRLIFSCSTKRHFIGKFIGLTREFHVEFHEKNRYRTNREALSARPEEDNNNNNKFIVPIFFNF